MMEEKEFEKKEKEEKEIKKVPKVIYHTLNDDFKQLQESGGQPDFVTEGKPAEIKNGVEEVKEEDSIFETPPKKPKVEIISPPSLGDEEGEKEEVKIEEKKEKRSLNQLKIFLSIFLTLFIILGALGGYFVFKKKEKEVSSIPSSTPSKPQAPSTPQIPSEPQKPPQKEPYTSLFQPPLNLKAEKELSSLSPIFLKSLLEGVASTPEEVGTLKEVIIYFQNKPLSFYDFFRILLPEVERAELNTNLSLEELFEKDLSVALFYSSTSVQLSYLALIKKGKESEVESFIKTLIQDPNLKFSLISSHFFVNPGNPVFENFKEGKIGPCKTFYLPYENAQLALNFGICQNYFLVASSKANVEALLNFLPL